jgi:hypothetical protein
MEAESHSLKIIVIELCIDQDKDQEIKLSFLKKARKCDSMLKAITFNNL